MEGITQRLVEFVVQTDYSDLPEEIRREAKRVLLDSIGCAVGGLITEKGKLAVQFAKRLGGPPESTIIGAGDKISCAGASFVDGELMNALDYDAILVTRHITPYVIPSALALAECNKSSGENLLAAIALGHEIAARIGLALKNVMDIVTEGPERGNPILLPVCGYSSAVFGGAAAAGKILGLDTNQMSHAFGIAGSIVPMKTWTKAWESTPLTMAKYLMGGWSGQAAVTSALLAKMGYTGIPAVLDGETGFLRYSGAQVNRPEKIAESVGERWRFSGMDYKQYPCCWVMHTALDAFIKLIDEHRLAAEDIESVKLLLPPLTERPVWQNTHLATHVDAQFSVPYVFAVAAHRIPPSPKWQDTSTMKDPRILQFMKRVSFGTHPQFCLAMLEEPSRQMAKVTITTRDGRKFEEERTHTRWLHRPPERRATDQQLCEKFASNAAGILPASKVDKVSSAILELEKIKDVSTIMKYLVA